MLHMLCATLGVGEIIVIVACAAIVLGVAIAAIVRRVRGKHVGCDCDGCSGCSGCCSSKNKEK